MAKHCKILTFLEISMSIYILTKKILLGLNKVICVYTNNFYDYFKCGFAFFPCLKMCCFQSEGYTFSPANLYIWSCYSLASIIYIFSG